MSAPLPRPRPAWPLVLLGYAAGVLIFLLLEALRAALLGGGCQGQIAWLLFAPLLLGPGGLAVIALGHARGKRWALMGLGLMVASLFPALFFAGVQVGQLRAQGCAGAYVVFSTPEGGKLGELDLPAGDSRSIRLRVGGVRADDRAPWQLSAQGHDAGGRPIAFQLRLEPRQAPAQTPVTLHLTVPQQVPVGQYSLEVRGVQPGGHIADGSLTVNVTR